MRQGRALLLAAASTLIVAASAQAAGYKAPRNSDGTPDLGGAWTNATITPLERPAQYGDRLVLTAEEAAKLEGARQDQIALGNRVTDPNSKYDPKAPCDVRGFSEAGCGYNAGWTDPGFLVMRVNGEPRASFITNPKNGRVPPRLPTAPAPRAPRRPLAPALRPLRTAHRPPLTPRARAGGRRPDGGGRERARADHRDGPAVAARAPARRGTLQRIAQRAVQRGIGGKARVVGRVADHHAARILHRGQIGDVADREIDGGFDAGGPRVLARNADRMRVGIAAVDAGPQRGESVRRAFARLASKRSGSAKTRGSRLAAPISAITIEPAGTSTPPIVTSRSARRNEPLMGPSTRRHSSTKPGMAPERATRWCSRCTSSRVPLRSWDGTLHDRTGGWPAPQVARRLPA